MNEGAVIVMPRRRAEGGPVAGLWTLAAGWGKAAERRFGHAWVVTLDGVASPDEVLAFADPAPGPATRRTPKLPAVPMVIRTAAKDLTRAYAARSARHPAAYTEWADHELAFVLAAPRSLPVPRCSASRAATAVRSSRSSTRPWCGKHAAGGCVARAGVASSSDTANGRNSARAMSSPACPTKLHAKWSGSEFLANGSSSVRPRSTPTGSRRPRPSATRHAALGLGDGFVVGWAGTFRRFQGLDTVVDGFGQLHRSDPRARLLLVGDGAERGHVEGVVDDAGLRDGVVFTGAVGARAVADYLNLMDVAVVSARAGDGFHYSPLKLREYLACGVAVLAPRVGEIPGFVTDGVHALLYQPGDANDLARKLRTLRDEPDLRARLGAAGRALVVDTATWDTRLTELLDSTAFRAAVARSSDPA